MTLTKEEELKFYTLNIKDLKKGLLTEEKNYNKRVDLMKKQIEELKIKKLNLTEEIKKDKLKPKTEVKRYLKCLNKVITMLDFFYDTV